jgi:hypothetical protein
MLLLVFIIAATFNNYKQQNAKMKNRNKKLKQIILKAYIIKDLESENKTSL